MFILIDSFLCLSIITMVYCSSSSMLLNRLRKEKSIRFQSKFSSPIEINLEENSRLEITCSFYSNFDLVDLFWLHNGTLIQAFISQNLMKNDDETFLGVNIISTLSIERIHLNLNGFYQCIVGHQEIHDQQTFHININTTKIDSSISKDALITVHTSEVLFETRDDLSLICRVNQNQCEIQWFDENNHLLNSIDQQTDLIFSNGTLQEQISLYTCQICCFKQCQRFSSFIYPTGKDD